MLLQRVWRTAYNRIFRVRKIIVRIYFDADRIRVGGGIRFTVRPVHPQFVCSSSDGPSSTAVQL
jgi:hypothetical protein